jgi:hypothetical protein
MKRREIAQALFASAAGTPVLASQTNAADGNQSCYPRTRVEIEANVTPKSLIYPFGDLRRYGGDASGATDSSAALQTAATLGNIVIPQGCTFSISKGATRNGRIFVQGFGQTSQLLCDSIVLTVNEGTGSVVDNFAMLNISEPWIITRNPSNWHMNVSDTLRRSNAEGYQPTVNDGDVWGRLTTAQKTQQIGPSILFQGNSTGIAVSRMTGRFVVLGLYDTQYSSVCDCDIRGGKGGTAAIFFWNINNQIGQFNKALRNSVRYSSFSSIVFARNFDFQVQSNICVLAGESGIKTWQGMVGDKDSRCYRGQIQNNSCKLNYYDGIDAMSDSPSSDDILTYHQIQGNYCDHNGGDGINCNGQFNQITDNHLSFNARFGLWGAGLSLSKISGNFCVDNNQARNSSQHDLSIVGNKSNNIISDNWVWAGAGQNNYGIYAPGSNFVAENYGVNGSTLFFGKPGGTR